MRHISRTQQQPSIDGYLTSDNLANRLGLHPSTLAKWRMARTGPPFVRVGKRILYSVTSVERWMKANEQQPLR